MGFGAGALVQLLAMVLIGSAVFDIVLVAIAVQRARRTGPVPGRMARAVTVAVTAALVGYIVFQIGDAKSAAMMLLGAVLVLIAPGLGAFGTLLPHREARQR